MTPKLKPKPEEKRITFPRAPAGVFMAALVMTWGALVGPALRGSGPVGFRDGFWGFCEFVGICLLLISLYFVLLVAPFIVLAQYLANHWRKGADFGLRLAFVLGAAPSGILAWNLGEDLEFVLSGLFLAGSGVLAFWLVAIRSATPQRRTQNGVTRSG